MFVKNLLTAGDLLTVVPAGLPVTLQYDEKGIIQKVLEGYEDDAPDLSGTLLKPLLKAELIPSTIPVKNGTTWIKGVIHTDVLFDGSGYVSDVSAAAIKEKFSTLQCKFYAGNVSSLATQFKGAMPIRQWLSMAHFNVLPGFLIPANITREKFIQMIDRPDYPFTPALITHYMIYNRGEFSIQPTCIKQYVAKSVSQIVDDYGYIWAKLKIKDSTEVIHVPYSDAVRFNIQTNTAVVLDHEHQVIYSRSVDNKVRDKRSSKISCTVCGRVFECPTEGSVQCPDSHCNSRMYPQISHMLMTLGLLVPTKEEFNNILLHRGKLFSVVDVLDSRKYEDVNIQVPLYKALGAVVPIEVTRNSKFVVDLCNRCNNTINTLSYYLEHPDRISTDLGMVMTQGLLNFTRWIQDPQNLADVESILHHPKIHIVATEKLFDGAPIFRNQLIYITGAFIHGNDTEVAAILRSYGAEVVTSFSDKVTGVLVGGCNDGINASVIRQAHETNTPVMYEAEFFDKYGIDSDLNRTFNNFAEV